MWPAITTFDLVPSIDNCLYQVTTQGPDGSTITPSGVILPSSTGASTPALSIWISVGVSPFGLFAAGVLLLTTIGPGRAPPLLGTSAMVTPLFPWAAPPSPVSMPVPEVEGSD